MSTHTENPNNAPPSTSSAEAKLPEFMKAAQGKAFGSIDDQIEFTDKMPVPKLDPKDTKRLLAKVHAASTAPGDVRVIKGQTRFMQTPPTGFPYVPCGDFSGEVVQVPEPNETGFEVGDKIISLFEEPRPHGALCEYTIVKGEFCAKRPKNTSAVEAACLPSSALSAMRAVESHVKEGDRVLVVNGLGGVGVHMVQLLRQFGASYIATVSTQADLMKELGADRNIDHTHVKEGDRVLVVNGSGGVGVHMVQLLKQFGASYIATVSTQADLMKELGADRNIDHTKEKWSELEDFRGEGRFDLVLDLWGSPEPWSQAKSSVAVKKKSEGGRFVTFIGDTQYPIVHSVFGVFPLMTRIMARLAGNKMSSSQPKYAFVDKLLTVDNENFHRLSERVEKGELKPVMDPRSPFPFTLEGVKDALKLQESRHAHGKVVIEVSKE